MLSFRLVELECPRDPVQDAGRRPTERAAFELGVVLDAHAGQRGDLAAAQPRHTPSAVCGYAGLFRGDLGAPRDEELADFGSIVHVAQRYVARPLVGMPCQYTSQQELSNGPRCGFTSLVMSTAIHTEPAARRSPPPTAVALLACSRRRPARRSPRPQRGRGRVRHWHAPRRPRSRLHPCPPAGGHGVAVRIELVVGDKIATATLSDTPEARDFAAMLPVTLDMDDRFGLAKASQLPRELDVDHATRSRSYTVGDLVVLVTHADKIADRLRRLGSVGSRRRVSFASAPSMPGWTRLPQQAMHFTMTIRRGQSTPLRPRSPLLTAVSRRTREKNMRGVVMYAPGDVRSRTAASRGSSSQPMRSCAYRRHASAARTFGPIAASKQSSVRHPLGHESAVIIEEVGGEVTTIKPGQFSYARSSHRTTPATICRAVYQSSCYTPRGCRRSRRTGRAVAVPLADGTLVATPRGAG